MGFGTLFIGYFFLLNFPYCEYTDAIAAVLILYALYKLSGINEWFKRSALSAIAFAVLGVFELGIELFGMMSPTDAPAFLLIITTSVRHIIVAALTLFMMLGIRDVSIEVGLSALAEKSLRSAFVTVAIYTLSVFLESSLLALFVPMQILAWLYVFTTLATVTLIIFNLTCIFSAYMRICMPDDKDMEDKESRFAFVNAFRKHEEEKSREYAEYRLEKMKKKQEKKK